MDGIDFSKCKITNTVFDMKSLKGIKVSVLQCHNIVGMLGVKVVDE